MSSSLFEAVEQSDLAAIDAAIEAGAVVDERDELGLTVLMRATAAGDVAVVQKLLDHHAEIDGDYWAEDPERADEALEVLPAEVQVNYDLQEHLTPFVLAITLGHEEIVRRFLAAGAAGEAILNPRSFEFDDPLVFAAKASHTAVIALLLEAGAAAGNIRSEGPLIAAAGNGNLEAVDLLVAAGAEVEEDNEDGFRPLIEAAAKGHLEVVRRLVELGADVDHVDGGGRTALTVAREGGHEDVVEYLSPRASDDD